MITEIEPKPWHCGQMARRLRSAHGDALSTMGVKSHLELRAAFDSSVIRAAWLVDGELAALAGVVGSMASPEGNVWLAMTDKAAKHPVGVMRRALRFLDKAMAHRSRLSTIILDDDKPSAQFALALGFLTEETGSGLRVMSIKKRKAA